jgi:hypothetical protein
MLGGTGQPEPGNEDLALLCDFLYGGFQLVQAFTSDRYSYVWSRAVFFSCVIKVLND